MRLLLDENLPKRVKLDFADHEIFTVWDKRWNGKKNGELLRLMIAENFDALITFDKNLPLQQNFQKYSLPVLVLNASDNSYVTLAKLIPKIKSVLNTKLQIGTTQITE